MSSARIRYEGDLARRREGEEVRNNESDCTVSWWFHQEGTRFGLAADLRPPRGR